MSPLAQFIYQALRIRVPANRPELSYTDLVAQLPAPYDQLEPEGELLRTALGEVVMACRAKDLPAITAMVVRYRERVPGPGYYPTAHPAEADDPAKAMIAWGIEISKVRAATYPPTI